MQQLKEIKGIGPKTLTLLNKLNIKTIDDLISFYPFRYEVIKRSNLNDLYETEKVIIDGTVENHPSIFFLKNRLDKMNFKLNIGSQLLNIVLFNRAFLKPRLTPKTKVTIIGKYNKLYNNIVATEIRFGLIKKETIEPIYSSTYGLTSLKIKEFINQVLLNYKPIEKLPQSIKIKYDFLSKIEAINTIHNPTNIDKLNKIREQLKYEELFLFMIQMNYLKLNKFKHKGIKREVDYKLVTDFINKLPFKLTEDQLKSVKEIYNNLLSSNKMNRLLQGDVGSGKTIVAVISMYINYLSGYMSALMVPTEVLANQHYKNISEILKNYNIKVALLTGKLKEKEKKEIQTSIKNKEIDIVIGTHALITDNVHYSNLGLVITDEQHRFGVNQRNAFKNKGNNPDILYMSATPIPRTYALTLYGDMDISSIKTMPKGRKLIKTYLENENNIEFVLKKIYDQLLQDHQIYIIVPLIEESDKLDLEHIEEIYKKYKKAFSPKYNIAKIHGKMTSEEKEKIMTKFMKNKIQILISTTVIEVGVNVLNATMIVIYDAYRFGLSSLHQLRGRVGRSEFQSSCILISPKETKRLQVLTKTMDGFVISEEDFKIRGSGDLFGIKQSGDMSFSIADIKKDYNLLLKANEDSLNFLNQYSNIEEINNDYIKKLLYNTIDLG